MKGLMQQYLGKVEKELSEVSFFQLTSQRAITTSLIDPEPVSWLLV